jgi:hypothetical protein
MTAKDMHTELHVEYRKDMKEILTSPKEQVTELADTAPALEDSPSNSSTYTAVSDTLWERINQKRQTSSGD